MSEWRPIKTAPKTGEKQILIAGGSYHSDDVGCEISSTPLGTVEAAVWCETDNRWESTHNELLWFTPNWWRPMPSPPEAP